MDALVLASRCLSITQRVEELSQSLLKAKKTSKNNLGGHGDGSCVVFYYCLKSFPVSSSSYELCHVFLISHIKVNQPHNVTIPPRPSITQQNQSRNRNIQSQVLDSCPVITPFLPNVIYSHPNICSYDAAVSVKSSVRLFECAGDPEL